MHNRLPGKNVHDCDRYRYSFGVVQLLHGHLLYNWTARYIPNMYLLLVAKGIHEHSRTSELKIAVCSLVQRASGDCPVSVMRSDMTLLFCLRSPDVHYYATVEPEEQMATSIYQDRQSAYIMHYLVSHLARSVVISAAAKTASQIKISCSSLRLMKDSHAHQLGVDWPGSSSAKAGKG